jgi:hypothetical protein
MAIWLSFVSLSACGSLSFINTAFRFSKLDNLEATCTHVCALSIMATPTNKQTKTRQKARIVNRQK